MTHRTSGQFPTTSLLWMSVLFLGLCPRLFAVMPFNADAVAKSVVYILGPPDASGNLRVATGFLLFAPLKSAPGRGVVFLVTARHVFDPQWACSTEPNPTSVLIRVNKKGFNPDSGAGGTGILPLPLVDSTGRPLWYAHRNPSIDLAVIPVDPTIVQDFEHSGINYSQIATADEIKRDIVIGADIASAGLVPDLVDEKRNYPVFKFGKISFLPDEAVRMPCPSRPSTHRTEYVWWIAANAVPGNSGSPVVFVPDFLNIGVARRAMVIGVLATSDLGADVAGVVPVGYLDDIFRENFADLDLTRGQPAKPEVPSAAK
jgi:hypothetical protein